MRRAMVAACSFGLVLLGGCIMPYVAYPKLDYTPSVKLEAPSSEVRAFRVDISKPTADMGVFVEPIYERLMELPVTNVDEAPAQLKPSFTYGFVVLGGALNYLTHTSHSVALRLYRPGYELVEIKSWELSHRVAWKPADDLEAQAKALDDLFQYGPDHKASKSKADRAILLFGASEYERLVDAVKRSDQPTRFDIVEINKFDPNPSPIPYSRLAAKAAKLHKWAEE